MSAPNSSFSIPLFIFLHPYIHANVGACQSFDSPAPCQSISAVRDQSISAVREWVSRMGSRHLSDGEEASPLGNLNFLNFAAHIAANPGSIRGQSPRARETFLLQRS